MEISQKEDHTARVMIKTIENVYMVEVRRLRSELEAAKKEIEQWSEHSRVMALKRERDEQIARDNRTQIVIALRAAYRDLGYSEEVISERLDQLGGR